MIIIDQSELRSNSTMPNIAGSVASPNLEERTGADFMISPLQMPIGTDALLKKHIEEGALLIQRKHGRDLSASIRDGRLNSSLAKMHDWTHRPAQCVLLFTGFLTSSSGGKAVVSKQQTSLPYWTVMGAIEKWKDRGGSYTQLSQPTLLEEWANRRMQHLKEYQVQGIREIWPTKPVVQAKNFLQTLVPVSDARVLLATLPGIGEKTANLLWKAFNGNIINALCWLTMPHHKKYPKSPKIKGIGHKTIENVRKYFQLDDVMALDVNVMPPELWQGEAKGRQ